MRSPLGHSVGKSGQVQDKLGAGCGQWWMDCGRKYSPYIYLDSLILINLTDWDSRVIYLPKSVIFYPGLIEFIRWIYKINIISFKFSMINTSIYSQNTPQSYLNKPEMSGCPFKFIFRFSLPNKWIYEPGISGLPSDFGPGGWVPVYRWFPFWVPLPFPFIKSGISARWYISERLSSLDCTVSIFKLLNNLFTMLKHM